MGGDFPAGLVHGSDRLGMTRHGGRDRIDGDRHPAADEHAMEPPEAGARAIFVDRFHVHVPLAGPSLRTDNLGEERLGGRIAMQDAVLPALLVIDHELDGDARAARPIGVGRLAAIADKITWIIGGCGVEHQDPR